MIQFENHSGGAIGADSYWDEIGREYGFVNHFHYWYKRPNPKSEVSHQVSEENYLEGVKMIERANISLKRQHIYKYMHLLARNWQQVNNSEAIFAIGFIKNDTVQGGTGWAIQMAIDEEKDVYVFDQNKNKWYFYNQTKFEYCNTPILTKKYAGIGTRKISEEGINAIRLVYKKTIKRMKS